MNHTAWLQNIRQKHGGCSKQGAHPGLVPRGAVAAGGGGVRTAGRDETGGADTEDPDLAAFKVAERLGR